ncbi:MULTISPECIES: cytidylyltransferase domain-containing protein [unclassified Vibrio]|uniref:acylneuraminate cytidylyltransferase family protein n=1 Tax=unclassified Vibrio TaxID=2614977 RepID=UPI00159EA18F|nr:MULTISPECIES: acylneuraminate cytidylyltransferase family protein [unclassified Vibrio]NVN82671.1 acylneuraminate cytidylyltransferase family protein [Vibrio sp. Scap16]QLE93206.1 acylneuraminate cytidylyltransferase family protein [Vibrio sp. Scap24]
MLVYAVIPARSGSKGLPGKNIKEIAGKPLIAYSIEFAKSIECIDRVFCTTDSKEYANIAKKYGAEVPFLRSDLASHDTAMEQDILRNIREEFRLHGIEEPEIIVWLRPTFVFRSKADVEVAVLSLKNDTSLSAARTVIEAENRLYSTEKNKLVPLFDDKCKSMIRRQDMPKSYKVFSTDIFRFKGNEFGDDFLGRNVLAFESNKVCGLDIDDSLDFHIVRSLIENSREIVDEYLPKISN